MAQRRSSHDYVWYWFQHELKNLCPGPRLVEKDTEGCNILTTKHGLPIFSIAYTNLPYEFDSERTWVRFSPDAIRFFLLPTTTRFLLHQILRLPQVRTIVQLTDRSSQPCVALTFPTHAVRIICLDGRGLMITWLALGRSFWIHVGLEHLLSLLVFWLVIVNG